MRSSLALAVLIALARATHADPAVPVPYEAPDTGTLEHGACAKWSTGIAGRVCSFCTEPTGDDSCRMCRSGFGSATCSGATRGAPPTFGDCEAVGDDMVCRSGRETCRYSAERAVCYVVVDDHDRADVAWVDSRPPGSPPRCKTFPAPIPGRACVSPAPDGVHGKLCVSKSAQDPDVACVEVERPGIEPTFGDCSVLGDLALCTMGNQHCTYAAKGQTVACEDDATQTRRYRQESAAERAYRLPRTVAVGLEVGFARPGASDAYANGFGRAFVLRVLGFEARIFEGYDLPDPAKMYANVAGTSNAFVITSLAYRYQLASSSPVSLSLLGGIAVMHRSRFGTSGDAVPLPDFPADFPEVQQQLGVGALLGIGAVFYGLGYVDVRAYPTAWGASGFGDGAPSPGGIPLTVNAGFLLGF